MQYIFQRHLLVYLPENFFFKFHVPDPNILPITKITNYIYTYHTLPSLQFLSSLVWLLNFYNIIISVCQVSLPPLQKYTNIPSNPDSLAVTHLKI